MCYMLVKLIRQRHTQEDVNELVKIWYPNECMVLKMNEVRLTSYLGKHDKELNITWYHLEAYENL